MVQRGKATLVTRKDERVRVHPSSVNSSLDIWKAKVG